MGAILDAAINFFKEDEWSFTQVEDRPILTMAFTGKNGTWACYARAVEDKDIFAFYSYCPVKAPEDKRPIMADFLTRANYGLYVGNFEMDFNDGEVRYKTSIDVEGTELNSALIKRLVYDNLIVMDKYLPGIMAVIFGGASPTEAIAQVEN
jgi:hypothetical protein